MDYDLKPSAGRIATSYVSYVTIFAGVIKIDAAIKYASYGKI